MRYQEFATESKVNWAVGNNLDKSTENKFYQQHPNNVVVFASIEDLFKHTERGWGLDLNHPTGGDNAIKGRINRAMDHWTNNGYMDPSEINVNIANHRGAITFTNGRHRLYAAYKMGETFAPVIVSKDQLADLKTIVRIK